MRRRLILESTVYTSALPGRPETGGPTLPNVVSPGHNPAVQNFARAKYSRRAPSIFTGKSPTPFFLVDLPGYGYARASHSERRSWATLLEKYLSTCKNLRALALLLDSRLPPQKLDLELAGFARSCGLPLLPILTKADKCNQRERAARQAEWGEIVGVKPVITSSSKRMGMDALWQRLIEASGCAPVILEEEPAQPVTASLAEALARTTAGTEEKA